MYNFIVRFFSPLVKFIGRLHWPFTHKKITGVEYYKWRDAINVGTVFLTKTRGEISNIINPSKLKHGAIYLGYIDGIPSVLEAVGRGVVLVDLVTFLTTKDRVIALKPCFLTADDISKLPKEAMKRSGVPYDYLFSTDDEAYYCFELVADILKSLKPDIILKEVEVVKGYKIYDSSTFLKDGRFIKLFDSKEA